MSNILLHCDGADGATFFPDVSVTPHTMTAHGAAQVDTAFFKFATGSLLIETSSDFLDTPYTTEWDFGTGDWTIDAWVYPTNQTTDRCLISAGGFSSGWALYLSGTSSGVTWADSTGGWSGKLTYGTKVTNSTWTHVAVMKKSGVLYIFYDGVQKAHASHSGNIISNSSTLVIGKERTNNVIGNFDEIRVQKGVAAYGTGNDGDTIFTPESSAYTDESGSTTYDILNKLVTSFGNIAVVTNKVNYSKGVLQNILNKVNSCKRETLNIFNSISFLGGKIFDCSNKLNTLKQPFADVKNDVRFIQPWQRSATFGPQSRGKQYVKVYIDGIEQTDVDVDSISINKKIGTAHTAAFLLGRPYDAAKPNKELIVLIKYNDWTLYRGYVTRVSPTDSPDTIQVECQDEYWFQNRDVSYFFVGHKPPNDTITTYYDTIKHALSTEFSLNYGVGDFTPETISCYSIGKSEVLSSLIKTAGNYDYYYDINGNPQLWISGAGDIINLNLQQIGRNLNLYDVLQHRITSSIDDLVNKYRVLMGVEGARENNFAGSTVPYTIYTLSLIEDWCSPAWDGQYEILAKDAGDGKGLNWYPKEDAEKFADVFRVWNLPYFTNTFNVWSDKFPPVVKIYNNFGNFVNIFTTDSPELEITEGFSIDYEKRQIRFHDPLYLISKDGTGKIDKIKAPAIKIQLGLKIPQVVTDTRNPLVFNTAKMGSYPKTVQKNLILSQYTIELGAYYVDQAGNLQPIPGRVLPSWDDTPYALDVANWNLSKLCDEKVQGQLLVTLDAACLYNIDLKKRIGILGIAENPLNIIGISYNMSNFTVSIEVENGRLYNRTESIQKRWI